MIKIAIEDFRRLVGIDKGKYKKFTFVRMYVIEPAIKEINKKSDIYTTFHLVKMGRCISEIHFTVKSKKTQESLEGIEDIDLQLQQFGFTQKEIEKYKKEHSQEYITENIKIVEKEYEKGKVKNLKAYLKTALDKDFRPQQTEYEKNLEQEKEEKRKLKEQQQQEEQKRQEQESLFKELRRQKVEEWLQEQESQKLEEVKALFVEEKVMPNAIYKIAYGKYGFESPIIQPLWVGYIADCFLGVGIS